MARLTRGHLPRHGWTVAGVVLGATLLVLLWVTGVLLEIWPAQLSFQLAAWQMGLRHAALIAHGVGAWVVCGLIGRWIAPHAQRMWRHPRRLDWWLGLGTAITGAAVALTGLALLYGPGDWHDASAASHWWIALPWPLWLLWHVRRLWRPRALTRGRAP